MPNRLAVLDEGTGNAPHVFVPGQLVAVVLPGGTYYLVAYAPPSGACGGIDLTGTFPNNLSLINVGPGATGPIGSATTVPVVTIDAKGRVTALTSAAILIPTTQVKGATAGAVPFIGPTPGLLMTEDGTTLYWDNTNKRLGIGTTGAAVNKTLLVSKDTSSGSETVLPVICVANPHVSTAPADYSFSSFQMLANNGAVNGQFFADGSGAFIGTPSIYFRATTNHALVFGTNNTVRMTLTNGGNLGIGTTTAEAPLQLRAKGATDVYNTASAFKACGSAVQSTVMESLIRLVRNTAAGAYYSGVCDIQIGAYGAGGSPFTPQTKVIFKLKNAFSYNDAPDVEVLDLRANGQVQVPGTLRVGSTSVPTAKVDIAAGSTAAGSAPIKLTEGSLMTAPEVGAVEANSDKVHYTIPTGTARKEFTLNDAALTATRVPYATTNGRLTDTADLTWTAATAVLTPKNVTLGEVDWDDVTLPASRISNAPGTNPPSYDATERCHKFAQGLDRDIDLTFEIQHSYVEGTDVYLHVHGFNSTNGAGNVRIIVKWRVLTEGIAPPAWNTDAAFVYASGSTLNVQVLSMKTVSDATSKINSVFQFNLQFARNNVTDTYAGDVYVASYGIHYQKNTMGSQTIGAK